MESLDKVGLRLQLSDRVRQAVDSARYQGLTFDESLDELHMLVNTLYEELHDEEGLGDDE